MNTERAKAIEASSDWQEICKELDLWVKMQLERTKTCNPEDLTRIQAKISSYEEVKNLPRIVIDREE